MRGEYQTKLAAAEGSRAACMVVPVSVKAIQPRMAEPAILDAIRRPDFRLPRTLQQHPLRYSFSIPATVATTPARRRPWQLPDRTTVAPPADRGASHWCRFVTA